MSDLTIPTWLPRPWLPRDQPAPNPDTPVFVILAPAPVKRRAWWRFWW